MGISLFLYGIGYSLADPFGEKFFALIASLTLVSSAVLVLLLSGKAGLALLTDSAKDSQPASFYICSPSSRALYDYSSGISSQPSSLSSSTSLTSVLGLLAASKGTSSLND